MEVCLWLAVCDAGAAALDWQISVTVTSGQEGEAVGSMCTGLALSNRSEFTTDNRFEFMV